MRATPPSQQLRTNNSLNKCLAADAKHKNDYTTIAPDNISLTTPVETKIITNYIAT